MNVLFLVLFFAATLALLLTDPSAFLGAMLGGAADAGTFALRLFAIYAVWMMLLKWMELSGLSDRLARLFRPLLGRLFPGEKDPTLRALSLNLSANLLGMGGAATPMGLTAMQDMQQRRNRVMLVVINATSIQLLPTTVLGLRAAQGAQTDVILPTLLATALTTAIGVVLVRLFVR